MFSNRNTLKRQTLKKRIERILMAATFAEANEHGSALEMLAKQPEKRLRQRSENRKESRKDRRPVLMA